MATPTPAEARRLAGIIRWQISTRPQREAGCDRLGGPSVEELDKLVVYHQARTLGVSEARSRAYAEDKNAVDWLAALDKAAAR